MKGSNYFDVGDRNSFQLLNSAAIYGPNASGKSNLILAIRLMSRLVIGSAREWQEGDELPYEPFLFSSQSHSEDCELEVVFFVDRVRFQYGFTFNATRVTSEWLFAFPKGQAQRWYERNWSGELCSYSWAFSDRFVGEKRAWQESTRDNALFLSTAVMLNSEQLKPIYLWFRNNLRVAGLAGWNSEFTATLCNREDKTEVLSMLRSADLSITDIETEFEEIDLEAFEPDGRDFKLGKDVVQVVNIRIAHKDDHGNNVYLPIMEESDGTRRFFSFVGPWIDSLRHGYTVVIDELNTSLHPALVKMMLKLFHDKDKNPNHAQVIFTTHGTSILSQKYFRRDQVWFVEWKKSEGSVLYPLLDFKPKKHVENLELGYLSGRYGAIPFIDIDADES